MRRRQVPEDALRVPAEALRRFRVADWLQFGDVVPGEPWSAPGVRAWQRYMAARRAWAESHGVSLQEMSRLGRSDDAT